MQRKRRSKYEGMFKPNQIIGEWKVESGIVQYGERGRTYVRCKCLHCNTFSTPVPCHHLAKGRSTRCKMCNYSINGRGKSLNPHWNGAGEVPKTALIYASNSAVRHGEAFNLTPKYANSIYTATCSVTGQPISFDDNTARLAKIDNTGEYIEGNVTWVHAAVAPVLKKISKDEFINLCLSVAQKHKLKKE